MRKSSYIIIEQIVPTLPNAKNNSQVQDEPLGPKLQRNPAIIAIINPPSCPVISKVPVITVGSIGYVNSDEKFILIGIIGTMNIPISIVLVLIRTESFFNANVTTAQPQMIVHPMQLIRIINLNVLNLYMSAPTVSEAASPHITVMPHNNEVNPVPR